MQILEKLVPIAMFIFVLSSMLAMGLGLTIGQIIAPLRNLRLVAMSLLANFILIPMIAVALSKVLRLEGSFVVGPLLLGTAAGDSSNRSTLMIAMAIGG